MSTAKKTTTKEEKPVKPAAEKAEKVSAKKPAAPRKAAVAKKPAAEKAEKVAVEEEKATPRIVVSALPADTEADEVIVGWAEKLEEGAKGKYFWAVGRRKRATATIRLFTSNPQSSVEAGNLEINGKSYKTYFPVERFWLIVEEPFKKLKSLNRFRGTVHVSGGGVHSQAEAVRHAISRALTLFDANFRKRLKRAGFLKRDPREKERKKYGLKKARRRPQWAKR